MIRWGVGHYFIIIYYYYWLYYYFIVFILKSNNKNNDTIIANKIITQIVIGYSFRHYFISTRKNKYT